ncbi:MAG: von Willebrand factor type A domain protein [Candidatus Argoarchaeum ethanivorans]|uniref:von Willebrand factor type A domain protein n=1 Tax=Candidatus Argoarchaeum ethanivorans TaxID=2608793 RepID=A0A811TA29_9EURY|nr:MAG: von Willebrand factor type A domain protein [Candidatus Argoarchaeum ethanivorans]
MNNLKTNILRFVMIFTVLVAALTVFAGIALADNPKSSPGEEVAEIPQGTFQLQIKDSGMFSSSYGQLDDGTSLCSDIDMIFILDRSGSMDTWDAVLPDGSTVSRMEAAKFATKNFIDMLPTGTGTRVGVVSYESYGYARIEQSLTSDFAAAKSAVDSITDGGGTSIGEGIKKGIDDLQAHGNTNKRVFLLLTDGKANRYPYGWSPPGGWPQPSGSWSTAELYALYEANVALTFDTTNPTKTYTVGMGYQTLINENLLQVLASESGGKYFFAGTTSIQEMFDEIAAEICVGDINVLILANFQRMKDIGYSSASVDDLKDKLQDLADNNPNGRGVLVDLDTISSIKTAYTNWNGHESDITKTNDLVQAIDNYIEDQVQNRYDNKVKYVILVGSHEVLPMKARPDDYTFCGTASEKIWSNGLLEKSGYLYDIYHAGTNGCYLTDTIYADLSYQDSSADHELTPELAVGRLVETPDQIISVIDTYMDNDGIIPKNNYVSLASYDYLDCGTRAKDDMIESEIPTDSSLVKCSYKSSNVPPMLNAKHDIVYFAGHGDYNSINTVTNGDNIAFNKPVTVDSTYWGILSPYKKEKAVDGDANSIWASTTSSGSETGWICVDLEENWNICGIRLKWLQGNPAKSFAISTSLGGSTWTPRGSVDTGGFSSSNTYNFEIDDSISSGETIMFTGHTGSGDLEDGIDFAATSSDQITFDLKIDDKYDLTKIFYGPNKKNPPSTEFTLKNNIGGKPTYTPGTDLEYFIWYDGGKWHLRWTNGSTHTFTGTISCSKIEHTFWLGSVAARYVRAEISEMDGTPRNELAELEVYSYDSKFMAGNDPDNGDTSELNSIDGAVIITAGCHNGVNFGNKKYHEPDAGTDYSEFPEEFAKKGAVAYIGATGYTAITRSGCKADYTWTRTLWDGDKFCWRSQPIGFNEKLATNVVHNIAKGSTIGDAFKNGAMEYYIEQNNSYLGFQDTDRRVLAIPALYGIPTYKNSRSGTGVSETIGLKEGYRIKKEESRSKFGSTGLQSYTSSEYETIVLNITEYYVNTTTGFVFIPGMEIVVSFNDPMLPWTHIEKTMPLGSEITNVTWDEAASESIVLDNEIPIAGIACSEVSLEGNFSYDGFYPATPYANYSVLAFGAGGSKVGVGIHPVQYNSKTSQTKIWTKMVFDVQYNIPYTGISVVDLSTDKCQYFPKENVILDISISNSGTTRAVDLNMIMRNANTCEELTTIAIGSMGLAGGTTSTGAYSIDLESIPQVKGRYIEGELVVLNPNNDNVLGSDSVTFGVSKGTLVSITDATAQSFHTATVPIIINGMTNFGAATVTLSYDPTVVQITDVTAGDVGTPTTNINNTTGTATIVAYVSTATGPDSPITLAILELSAVGSSEDTSPITLAITTLADADGTSVSSTAESGVFVVCAGVNGDLNGDDTLTPADAAIALEIAVGSRPCDDAMLAAADVSGDGMVTSLDALMILQAAHDNIDLS